MIDSTERELIKQLKDGSIKAFDDIYDMYAKRLYAFSLQYTKVKEDAEEIVEDVFVQLWNGRTNIKQEDTLRSLLFIMAKHHLINAFRARVNSPIYEDYVDYQDKLLSGDSHYRIEYEEFVTQIKTAISKLPSTQQDVIKLSKIEQMNNSEIAKELSLSEQTVRNQLSIGLKALRENLKDIPLLLWLLFLVNNGF